MKNSQESKRLFTVESLRKNCFIRISTFFSLCAFRDESFVMFSWPCQIRVFISSLWYCCCCCCCWCLGLGVIFMCLAQFGHMCARVMPDLFLIKRLVMPDDCQKEIKNGEWCAGRCTINKTIALHVRCHFEYKCCLRSACLPCRIPHTPASCYPEDFAIYKSFGVVHSSGFHWQISLKCEILKEIRVFACGLSLCVPHHGLPSASNE